MFLPEQTKCRHILYPFNEVSMKTHPCLRNLSAFSASLIAMGLSLFAQNTPIGADALDQDPVGAGDTNEIAAAIAELQGQIAQPDVSAMMTFVNAPNTVARLKTAEPARQAVLAARQNVREEIELLADGAIARFGPHQVTFPAAMPAMIQLRMPDGLLLKGSVLGLAYVSDTGKSVLLAELKQSEGELADAKTVIYRDAFHNVSADLVYEYGRTAFEQLVVIRKRLPAPEELGFSADENVRLAVLTEWFSPPQPRKTARIVSLRDAYQAIGIQWEESLFDETLSFGAMRMIEGRSFTLGEPDLSVPTGKTWETLRGPQGEARQFLIEASPYRLLKPMLDALPVRTAPFSPREPQSLQAALRQLKAPTEPSSRTGLMAKAERAVAADPGVVLDYLIVNTALLNVEFVYTGKYGLAAFGYDAYDYWNYYDCNGCLVGWLTDLYWSDSSQSSAGLIVSNAPGVGNNSPLCDWPVDCIGLCLVERIADHSLRCHPYLLAWHQQSAQCQLRRLARKQSRSCRGGPGHQ
jgi:hypothetical protein